MRRFGKGLLIALVGLAALPAIALAQATIAGVVKDARGKVTTWNFELASVNSLRRNGWTQTSLKIGDTITAKGYAALASKTMANANGVTLADGTSLFAASSAPSVQQTPSR